MGRSARPDPWGSSVSAAVLLIVLIPYGALALPFDTSLYVQAGGILLGVAGLLAVSWRRSGGSGIADRAFDPLTLGLVLFVLAAVLGTGIGLWRGSALRDLAGQVLSMGLLPLAALAGTAARVHGKRRRLAWALVAATAGVCSIHLGDGLLQIVRGGSAGSMILANGVTAAGPALIALPLALALAFRERGRAARSLAWLAVGTIVSYAVGSGIRSLWVALVVAVPLFFVVSGEWRRRLDPRLVGAVLALLIGLVTGLFGAQRWIESGGEVTIAFPSSPALAAATDRPLETTLRRWEEPKRVVLTASVEVPPAGWYRLGACLSEASRGTARARVLWLDREGRRLGILRAKLTPDTGDSPTCVTRFGKAPVGTAGARLEILPISDRGEWHIQSVTLTHLGSGPWVSVARQMQFLSDRLGSLLAILQINTVLRSDAAPKAKTETIRFRWVETSRLLALFRDGTLPEKLFGHGLGARYRLDAPGWDNRGHWVHYEDVNYIHNFYAFLLYKLGVVGGGLVLAALALWLVWGVKRARGAERSLERACVAAGTAALIAATLWSLSSPVFLNFRLAPLWGLLLASMRARAGSDELRP